MKLTGMQIIEKIKKTGKASQSDLKIIEKEINFLNLIGKDMNVVKGLKDGKAIISIHTRINTKDVCESYQTELN